MPGLRTMHTVGTALRWGGLAALALGACGAPGAWRAPADGAIARGLEREIAALRAADGYRAARLGVVVRDLESGAVLYSEDAGGAFLPASTLKLFTAALALSELGPAWQARTRLYRVGELRGGVLEGDLLLRGGGDPALGRGEEPLAAFRAWGERLFQEGLRGVAGDILVDDGLFADGPLGAGWAWDDRAEPWSAPFGALSFHGNTVDLVFQPGAPGSAPVVTQTPHLAGVLAVLDRCLVQEDGAEELQLKLQERPFAAVATGVLTPSGGPQRRSFPVADPGLFAGQALRQALERAGIRVAGGVRRPEAPEGRTPAAPEEALLAETLSPPVFRLVETMLRESDNLYAENLFRLAGAARGARGVAAEHGRRALAGLLAGLGVDAAGLFAADGSGLSRLSQVTPAQVVGLLGAAREQPWGRFLVEALPRAGREGTLAGRFLGTAAEGVLRAKTGTLTRVAALSGYLPRPGRPPLAFSWLVQGFDCEEQRVLADIDRVLAWLAEARE